MNCSMPGFPVTHYLPGMLKLMFIDSLMPSNQLIVCHSLLLLPLVFPILTVFSNELALHIKLPKYWSFSISISPSKEYLGLISFRIDWINLLVVQGTLKNLLQHHSLKASILWHSTLTWVSTFTSIHDYWKNYNFDYTDFCWQSEDSAF